MNPAYKAIAAEAKRLCMPTAFRADLTKHDKGDIRRDKNAPFLWGVRRTGTDYIPLVNTTNYVPSTPSGLRTWLATIARCNEHWYYWTGTELRYIGPASPATTDKLLSIYGAANSQ